MNRIAIAVVLALVTTTAGRAQAPSGNPISRAVQEQWTGARDNIVRSADLMPEANYAFKPVDSVRSFGAILAHVAGANYVFCSAARGEPAPHQEGDFEKTAKTKADIVKALQQSIAYCDQAYAAMTDESASRMVKMPFDGSSVPRVSALIGNAGHLEEHYGNLVTYFRIKGMVPPSSQPR